MSSRTEDLWYNDTYIYIYIGVCECVSLNNKDKFCLYNLFKILSSFLKFETSKLILSNNVSPSTGLLDGTNVVYLFKCPLGDCVSKENSAYVDFTYTTLSRKLKIHLNDSNSIAFHLMNHSIPRSKFRKILVENTTIIEHEIDKLWLQILEAQHIKTKKPKINRINFENSDCFEMLLVFFSSPPRIPIVFYLCW